MKRPYEVANLIQTNRFLRADVTGVNVASGNFRKYGLAILLRMSGNHGRHQNRIDHVDHPIIGQNVHF